MSIFHNYSADGVNEDYILQIGVNYLFEDEIKVERFLLFEGNLLLSKDKSFGSKIELDNKFSCFGDYTNS